MKAKTYNIFIRLLVYICLIEVSIILIYYLFPKLTNPQLLNDYYISYGVTIGVIFLISVILLNTPIFTKNNRRIYQRIIFLNTIILLLSSVVYVTFFNLYSMTCKRCSDKGRYIIGNDYTEMTIRFSINPEIDPEYFNLASKEGICKTMYFTFACKPEDLWTSESIRANTKKLYYSLLLLITSLFLTLLFFVEFFLLSQEDGKSIRSSSSSTRFDIINSAKIKQLIAKNKLEESLVSIDDNTENEQLKGIIIGIQQELSDLNDQVIKGIIDADKRTQRRNQIRAKILMLFK